MKLIPNLFTLLNLVFGCLAIVYILQNGIVMVTDQEQSAFMVIPEKIWYASLFIGLAAVVDFVDGFVARLFKAASDMGKQLDSLADLVSFGVAPGLIMYQFLRLSVAKEANGLDTSVAMLLPSLLIPCAAAYRLARFNLDTSQEYGFKGLPVPATGMVIGSLPLIYWYTNTDLSNKLLLNQWFLYAVIILFSVLMVSRLPLISLKFKDYTIKNNLPKFILAIIAIVAGIFLHWVAIPAVIVCYIAVSLIFRNA